MTTNKKLIITIAGAAIAGAAVLAFQQRKQQTLSYGRGIKLKRAIIVSRPAEELYRHWRNLESLPNLIRNLESVEVGDTTHSCWKVSLPGGLSLRWNSEIILDRENEAIGWRSLENSDIDVSGSIRFESIEEGRGCIVRVALQYKPPSGKLGALAAMLAGKRAEALLEESLRCFKQLMETGGYETADGKTVSFMSRRAKPPSGAEVVQVTSEDSFPASDPPAWTGTVGNAGL